MSTDWLKNSVFYQIYPQSFCDSNSDGIGDLQGITFKLDYIKDLGCNAIWINPIYDSPFMDAGYDVRDYKKIAPRYGTMDDFTHLLSSRQETPTACDCLAVTSPKFPDAISYMVSNDFMAIHGHFCHLFDIAYSIKSRSPTSRMLAQIFALCRLQE